jgi:hypothetical protein
MGVKMNAYRILVGKPEGKSPLGSSRRGWMKNIKIDLREMGWVVRIGLMWLRIGASGGLCKHGNEPSGFIKFWEFLE